MRCANCGAENLAAARFCQSCGQSLTPNNICVACGAEVPVGSRFCNGCGAPMRLDARDQYESEVPETADPLSAWPEEPATAWREVTELMAGLATGVEPAPAAASAPRRLSAQDWALLLGEPLVSALALAPSMIGGGEGPGLSLAPYSWLAVDIPAASLLLSRQYSSAPAASKPAKGRRLWQ